MDPELLDGRYWVQDNRVSIKAADLVVGAGERLIVQGDFDLVGNAKDGPELGISDIDDAMERELEESLRYVTSDGHSIGDLFAFVIDGKSVHPLANRSFSSTPEVEGPDSVSAVATTRDEILFATRGIYTSLIYAYRGPDKDPKRLLDLKNSVIRVNHLSASSDGSTAIVITVNSMDLTGANSNTRNTNHAITVLKHWEVSDIIESILLED